ncbi:MAG: hypothetical protein GXO21_08250 [Aquificae bacterium]|nr:hypothetical protein [Aquificota bacterium]
MKNQNNKGIALVTTLVLGLIALTFIGALLYMLTNESNTSGITKRYTTALEAAKGTADYVISSLLSEKLICSSPDGSVHCKCTDLNENLNCPDVDGVIANKIVLPPEFRQLGDYSVNVNLLAKEIAKETQDEKVEIYSFQILSSKSTGKEPEKAEIDFVYKVTISLGP